MTNSQPNAAFDDIIASSGSLLVRDVARLTERQQRLLGVSAVQLVIGSLIFDVCVGMLDDSDTRPLLERFEDLEAIAGKLDMLGVAEAVDAWSSKQSPDLPRWLKRSGAPNYEKFLRRFLGAGPYDSLRASARADGAVVFVAARRSLRYVLPIATAFDHIIGVLTPEEVSRIEGLEPIASSSLLKVAVSADSKLNDLLERGTVEFPTTARPDELLDLPGTLSELTEQLCGTISTKSSELIEDLSATLSKKVQGAHDALKFSADPVSQAANSLIELIDRMLREAFTDAEVLSWLTIWYADQYDTLTHVKDGNVRPTKRGQALCFVHAGGEVADQTLIQDVAATTLVAARKGLQQLKHADNGSDADKQAVARSLVTVESVLLLTCKLAWLGAGEARLAQLRNRLAAA